MGAAPKDPREAEEGTKSLQATVWNSWPLWSPDIPDRYWGPWIKMTMHEDLTKSDTGVSTSDFSPFL